MTTTSHAEPQSSSNASFYRTLNGSMVGVVLEWYDFAIYGALAATVFAHQFFPKADPQAGLLLAFGTQAVGFLARPLGGIVFGHIGDRMGRKPAFIMTYLLLGIATASIGLLPTYATWGIAAPLLLVLARFIQGFALGGEFGAAITLVSEHSTPRNRGFWVSIPQTGGPAGTLLGAGVLAIIGAVLGPDDFQAWGWRVAFLIAIPLLLVGAWMRRGVEESPIFQENRAHAVPAGTPGGSAEQFVPEHGERGLKAALRNPVPILQGLGVRIGENVAFYVYTVFMMAYATQFLHYPAPKVLLVVTVASAFQLVGMLLGGWSSDRFGRKPVMIGAALFLAVWAPVFFTLASQGIMMLGVGVCVGAFAHGLLAGPEAAWIAELFPTEHRTAGTSLAVQGSSIFGGGPAPLIATALIGSAAEVTGVIGYLVVCALLSVVSVATGPETKGRDLA